MSLLLISFCVFGTVWLTMIGVLYGKKENRTQERVLKALGQVGTAFEEDTLPLSDRFMRPMLHKIASKLIRWSPKRQHEQITWKLSAAGLLGHWDVIEWKGLQYTLSFIVALLFFATFFFIHAGRLIQMEMAVIGFVIGYIFPNSWLKTKAKQRQREIVKTLPDVLDLLTVSVEAGLGFDAALLKVVEKQKGVLAEELLKVLQEIKMGRPRRETLRDLANRNNSVEDLKNVVASLVQADQLGISIGGVLRSQSKQIRQKQRQRAEEKAQKAPVKMMIPLVFFVFPTIFIIVLGPAVIQIIDIFKQR